MRNVLLATASVVALGLVLALFDSTTPVLASGSGHSDGGESGEGGENGESEGEGEGGEPEGPSPEGPSPGGPGPEAAAESSGGEWPRQRRGGVPDCTVDFSLVPWKFEVDCDGDKP